MAALDGPGRFYSRRKAPERGGGRTGRRRGRRPSPVDCWLRECYVDGLRLPACSEELGASFYSATRLAPAVVDKNDGESPFCSQGARGGDEH